MDATAVAIAAFPLAVLVGGICGRALCGNTAPYRDGPDRVDAPWWTFALAGAGCGGLASLHAWTGVHVAFGVLALFLLAACAATDLWCGMLPDVCTVVFGLVGLSVAALTSDVRPLYAGLLIMTVVSAIAWLSHGRGFGWGDVKLATAGGVVLGLPLAVMSYALACAALLGIGLVTRTLRRPAPFGAYLAACMGLTYVVAAR